MKKLTPHQKIMRAARKGTGLRLSAEEVWQLSLDGAISTRAADDDEYVRNPEAYALWDQYEGSDFEASAAAKQRLIEMGELRPPVPAPVIHFGRHREVS